MASPCGDAESHLRLVKDDRAGHRFQKQASVFKRERVRVPWRDQGRWMCLQTHWAVGLSALCWPVSVGMQPEQSVHSPVSYGLTLSLSPVLRDGRGLPHHSRTAVPLREAGHPLPQVRGTETFLPQYHLLVGLPGVWLSVCQA